MWSALQSQWFAGCSRRYPNLSSRAVRGGGLAACGATIKQLFIHEACSYVKQRSLGAVRNLQRQRALTSQGFAQRITIRTVLAS